VKTLHRAAALCVAVLSLAGSVLAATPLYNFGFEASNGSGDVSSLVTDQHGALYGTTQAGGSMGEGTVFQLAPPGKGETTWKLTVLYSFCQVASCIDGKSPVAGLIWAKQPTGVTALFGTTQGGGSDGWGTVFRLTPPGPGETAWTETVLHSFRNGDDGNDPLGRLVADTTGPFALYGTTNGGGTGVCDNGCGTIFKLTPPTKQHPDSWQETVLYSFGVGGTGWYPKAGLIIDNQGALYGTTYEGGASGYGTAFVLKPPATGQTNWTYSTLHDFAGKSDGANPRTGLLGDAHGGLYGTTAYGGDNCDSNSYSCGTVFKLVPPDKYVPTWTVATLHSFKYEDAEDGHYPLGDLIFGKDGAIYGTTQYGGTPTGKLGPCGFLYRCGTIFRLEGAQAEWTLSTIYKFCSDANGCPIGAYPTAGLVAYQGVLYGTTSSDGEGYACGCGAIFELEYPNDRGRRD